MRSFFDISYGSNGCEARRLDIHLPDSTDPCPVMIYFHGGGLEKGDKGLPKIAESVTRRGIAFVSANYRMFPDARYPDFIEDAAEAVAWVVKSIADYCAPCGIYVGGSSAGGYLSMMLCFDNRWLSKHGISPMSIDGFIHDAGQPTAHYNVLKYSGVDSRRVIVDDSAPLYHVGEADEYPRMLFIVSDNDMQNRPEQTSLMISTLKHFGHTDDKVSLIVRHGKHCHYVKSEEANGENSLAVMIADFIDGK